MIKNFKNTRYRIYFRLDGNQHGYHKDRHRNIANAYNKYFDGFLGYIKVKYPKWIEGDYT